MKSVNAIGKGILRFLPAVFWMCLIFWLSDRPADVSTVQSRSITLRIIKMAGEWTDSEEARQGDLILLIEPYVREIAHFAEYAILFILVFFAAGSFAGGYVKTSMISLFICFVYAISDELHQFFVQGRSCEVKDIIFDTVGALTAMLFIMVIKLKSAVKKDRP